MQLRLSPHNDHAAQPGAAATPLVLSEISKSYGPVKALRHASLALPAREIHALVGENGSGKSTFVGIVSGTVKPDTGTVTIAGKACRQHTPWESQKRGALTIFQDGSVVPELTVAQNLYLGTPAAQRGSYRDVEAWSAKRLSEYGLGRLPVRGRADRLSPGDRQLLEIVRALMARPTVLLLDEATSALDSAGVDLALDLMRKAADEGCAVLFVTHRLSEVFRVADRISVLRDGAWQGTHDAGSVDSRRLVELMAGRSVDVEFPQRAESEELGEIVLSATEVAGPGYGPVDVAIRSGEIVGIAGADDNGQLELLRGLAGIGVPDGRLEADGRPIATYGDGVAAGVLLLSADRRNESLFAPLAIRENLAAGMLGKLSRLGVVSWRGERALVGESVRRFGIRMGSSEDKVTSLSGGNQQKVALGRVLATEPDVLLIHEPTLGVDVRSRMDIYRMLRDNARRGLAVVLVSSDAFELAGLCDRILVVSRGSIVAELPGAAANEESIVHAFAGAEHGAMGRAVAEQDRHVHAGGRIRQFVQAHENPARLLLLVLLLLALGAYAQSRNSTFLSTPSLYNIFLLSVPLAAVAAAEFVVLFAGGIDVSVGAAMGVTVALMSFVVSNSSLVAGIVVSLGIALGFGFVVGAVNATLIERIRMSPVIATIATLGILEGVGLQLRPTAAGAISTHLTDALTNKLWVFPWVLLVLAALFVAADWLLRSSGHGLRVRTVGLNPQFAFRLGVNAPRLRALSYVGSGILAAAAGVLLAGQVGVGDSTVGNQYTLLAIAAPVLGGASLLGGYGSFVGCLLGAIVLALAQTLPTTLGLNDAASYLLTGALTLVALLVYSSGAAGAVRTYARTVSHKVRLFRTQTSAAPAGRPEETV
jgi:ribose transport system ATP-binding protein